MNQDHIQFIFEHTYPRISVMKQGEISDSEGFFDPALWYAVASFKRRYVFGRPVSRLVKEGKLPLEFAGFNSERHNLYRKK